MVIGITGGIGAGKSVVSRVLRCRGYEVYDCDAEAKALMDASDEIKMAIADRFGEECLGADGSLNRRRIAGVVFADAAHRGWLNALVHAKVHEDLERRIANSGSNPFFVESAIMHTSHLDLKCDQVWIVEAPEAVRLARTVTRDGADELSVRRRMAAQTRELDEIEAPTSTIDNDGRMALLPQIDKLLENSKLLKI